MNNYMECFPAVWDKNSKVMFLGTIPSKKAKGFYYTSNVNSFWKLLDTTLDTNFKDYVNDYIDCVNTGSKTEIEKAKKELICALHKKNIALWDTIKCCETTGSRDDQILEEKTIMNKSEDFIKIMQSSNIKHIFCTSQEALSRLQKIFGGKKNAISLLQKAMNLNEDQTPYSKLISPSPTVLQYGAVTVEKRQENWNQIKKYI